MSPLFVAILKFCSSKHLFNSSRYLSVWLQSTTSGLYQYSEMSFPLKFSFIPEYLLKRNSKCCCCYGYFCFSPSGNVIGDDEDSLGLLYLLLRGVNVFEHENNRLPGEFKGLVAYTLRIMQQAQKSFSILLFVDKKLSFEQGKGVWNRNNVAITTLFRTFIAQVDHNPTCTVIHSFIAYYIELW